MKHRIKQLENASMENNIILQGIPEGPWETNEVCWEKVCQVLSNLVNKDTYEECIDNARKIPIKTVKRLGTYSLLRRRPIVITFECYGDVEYLLANKK